MRFKVLGPLEVEGDDGPVPIVGQRPRALLTALLMQPNQVIATERLVDAVRGEDPPETPANALQQVVTRLRARLGDGASCLATAPGGYQAIVAPGALDADEFESGCRRARRIWDTEPDAAVRELETVLAAVRNSRGIVGAAATRLCQLGRARIAATSSADMPTPNR